MSTALQTKKNDTLFTSALGERRFEIVSGGDGVGFYLYVFEGERCTHDHLQDTVTLTQDFAQTEYGVPLDSWTKRVVTIGPQSAMSEVLAAYPGAQRALFRRYHIGGCSSCGFQPGETLGQVCARNGNLDVAEVLEHIKASHEQDAKVFIEPKELAALMAEDKTVRLLDVRSREEFEAVRIEGSVMMSQPTVQEIMAHWPRDRAFVIVDHEGKQALDAAAYFMGHGFEKVRCLRGGIDAWAREVDVDMRQYRLA